MRNPPSKLKLSNDYAWRNPNLMSKAHYCPWLKSKCAKSPLNASGIRRVAANACFLLLLLACPVATEALNKNRLLAVQQKVTTLVEEREPK